MTPVDPSSVIHALTVPESVNTLQAQQEQLLNGNRSVQMYPTGSAELPLPPNFGRVETTKAVFHFNPKHITPEAIHSLSDNGMENQLLGLGPFSKADVFERLNAGDSPLTVAERKPDGTEVRAALGSKTTAPMQMAEMHRGMTPGNMLNIEHPGRTLMLRLLSEK